MNVSGQIWKIQYKRLDSHTLDVTIVTDYVTSPTKPTRDQEQQTLNKFAHPGQYVICYEFEATPVGQVI